MFCWSHVEYQFRPNCGRRAAIQSFFFFATFFQPRYMEERKRDGRCLGFLTAGGGFVRYSWKLFSGCTIPFGIWHFLNLFFFKKFAPPFHWWFVNFPEWSYCGCSYVGNRWFIARACIENRLITFLVTPNMEKRVGVSKPTQTSEYKNEQGQTRCLHAPVVNHRILYFVEKVLKIYSTREIS